MPVTTKHQEDPSVGISLSIKKSNLDRARRIALLTDRSVSWVVDRALAEWIERNPQAMTTSTAT